MITNFIKPMSLRAHYEFFNYLSAVYAFAKDSDGVTPEMFFFHGKVLSINAPRTSEIWVNVETSETVKIKKVLPYLSALHDGIANVSDAKGQITFVKTQATQGCAGDEQVLTFEAFADCYVHTDALYRNPFHYFKTWAYVNMDSLPDECKQSALHFLNADNFAAVVNPAVNMAVAAHHEGYKAGWVLGMDYQDVLDTFAPDWEQVLFNGDLDVCDDRNAYLIDILNLAFVYELAVKLTKENQK